MHEHYLSIRVKVIVSDEHMYILIDECSVSIPEDIKQLTLFKS